MNMTNEQNSPAVAGPLDRRVRLVLTVEVSWCRMAVQAWSATGRDLWVAVTGALIVDARAKRGRECGRSTVGAPAAEGRTARFGGGEQTCGRGSFVQRSHAVREAMPKRADACTPAELVPRHERSENEGLVTGGILYLPNVEVSGPKRR